MTSLDGCFEGPEGDLSWHHTDEEFNDFSVEQMNEAGTILMGRKTYELMKGYWTSPEAYQSDPVIAEKMNTYQKVVFSRTLQQVNWENSILIKENVEQEVGLMKRTTGKDMIIFGSANLAASLLKHHLIDEWRIMVNPVLIGKGRSLSQEMEEITKLKLVKWREFNSGKVLLCYTCN